MNQQKEINSREIMNKPIHVFLVRGLTRESGHWGDFDAFLKKNIPDVQIHFLDLPGAGKFVHFRASSKMNRMVDFMRSHSSELIGSISEPKIILATSLAGMMAVDWITRYPDDFQGLIMVGSSFKKICSAKERVHKRVLGDMIRILISSDIEKRERLIINVNSNQPQNHHKILHEWIKIQSDRKMTRMNILRQTLAGMRFRTIENKLELPVLIVGSKADRMVCPECIKKTQNVFGGTLVWHETSGHGIALDVPEWLAQISADWIGTKFNH